MGCLLGARLSPHAGVTLVGTWPDQLRALAAGPLRVIEPDGTERRVPVRATGDLDAIAPVDIALIVTKTPKTAAAARGAARILKPGGLAISLQNGAGNREVLAGIVGDERAAVGVTTLGATTDGQPGLVIIGGTGPTTLATRFPGDPAVAALADLFRRAGLEVRVVEDASGAIWGKLAINAAINPLTALLGVRNGALLESGWARAMMAAAAREVAAVAAAQGIALPFDDPAAEAETVARRTAANVSSMLGDVRRGVPTEIDAICGAVVRAGETHGAGAPVNRALHALVKALEDLYANRGL
jgi:2-dehydropantoate 2-reductase